MGNLLSEVQAAAALVEYRKAVTALRMLTIADLYKDAVKAPTPRERRALRKIRRHLAREFRKHNNRARSLQKKSDRSQHYTNRGQHVLNPNKEKI